MNVKLEFVIELPEELRAAMSLNGETGLCSWIEFTTAQVEPSKPNFARL